MIEIGKKGMSETESSSESLKVIERQCAGQVVNDSHPFIE